MREQVMRAAVRSRAAAGVALLLCAIGCRAPVDLRKTLADLNDPYSADAPTAGADHLTPLATAVLEGSDARPSGSESEAIERIARELSRDAPRALLPEDREYFLNAARTAWRYGDQYSRPTTGMIAAVPRYDYATVWDLGSSVAMLFCARELGFIEEAGYKARMRLALQTLQRLALFHGAAFNKAYRVSTGGMVDDRQRASRTGFGWSATDLGRLLLWLRIVANRDPELAADASSAVHRLDFTRLVKDGYLWGEDLGPGGVVRSYIEGQLGYEQYAAQGFALWDARADKALRLAEHAIPIQVMGQTVAADSRRRDRLTSEPFVLMGLEFGWAPDVEQLARAVLEAQAERARQTGVLTIVSEDAIDRPPHYFYYYCVFANGRQFSIDVQDPTATVDSPRWVSSKAAIGWHALQPSAYTKRAIEGVEPARTPRGWASGVYERTARSTNTLNVNTEAVIMTAALYALRGKPMLSLSTAASVPRSPDHD